MNVSEHTLILVTKVQSKKFQIIPADESQTIRNLLDPDTSIS